MAHRSGRSGRGSSARADRWTLCALLVVLAWIACAVLLALSACSVHRLGFERDAASMEHRPAGDGLCRIEGRIRPLARSDL